MPDEGKSTLTEPCRMRRKAMPDQVHAPTASHLLQELPLRLHHNAYVCANQERTRHFYEDIVGLPLVATWVAESEFPEFPGEEGLLCAYLFRHRRWRRARLF